MSSQPIDHRDHPVADFAHRLITRLDDLAQTPLMSMSAEEKKATLLALTQGATQLETLRLRLLAEAEACEATASTGAVSAADWLAHENRQVRRETRSELRLAQHLETYPVLAAAMAVGTVNLSQARAITGALEKLPRRGQHAVTTEQRSAAEAHLVELAAHHDPQDLRILGGRVLEVIAPDLAEEHQGRALEREEAQALRRTTLVMWEDDEGTCHGRFRIPTHHAQMLTKAILALSSPTLSSPTRAATGLDNPHGSDSDGSGIDPDLPTPVRHGIALTQLIESITAKDLPKQGGCGATVVVTMTLHQLLADLNAAGVCTLDTGATISAAQARRLACQAGIIPLVLGGKSEVLDVGRRRRLHTEPMRLAMSIRDGGCTALGCQTPPGLCHAHHPTPWSHGGHTSLTNSRLLCPHHHRRIHDPQYTATEHPNGQITFHRRE